MVKINIPGLPERLRQGCAQLGDLLPVTLCAEGIPVELREGDCLDVSLHSDGGQLTYAEPAQFYRALAHLGQYGIGCHVRETPCFRRDGLMVDASRNAVPKPDSLRLLLGRMALLGLNMAMLYTEDTYEVEGEPYIGYLRGRYTKEELRELDDFAFAYGIELVPCIQTLAHFERILQWPEMWYFKDTESVSLVGEDKSYVLLEKMIRSATEPYRSKRVHIGMDEAWDIGLGQYLRKNGYETASAILQKHLARVADIVRDLGLEAMMWSDMYFRAVSPTGDYYESKLALPDELISGAPDDISLVYWDYFNRDPEVLGGMMQQHKRFAAPTVFAGGLWTWASPAPNPAHMLATTLPALAACRQFGVDEVMATAWGDDGGECSMDAVYYGMFIYAEYNYTGSYDEELCRQRFQARMGLPVEAWAKMAGFAEPPGSGKRIANGSWMCKYLLYEDPLLPLIDDGVDNQVLDKHFAALSDYYAEMSAKDSAFTAFFAFYRELGALLSRKCRFRGLAVDCALRQDGGTARTLSNLANEIVQSCEDLTEAWRELWFLRNKPNGFEVIDNRMGALRARFVSAAKRFGDLADGAIQTIPELTEKREPPHQWDGQPQYRNYWSKIVSPGIV